MEQLELDFEEWKPIKGYEGIYDISNKGQYHRYQLPHHNEKYGYGYNNCGYLAICLHKNGKKKAKRVHIIVYETFIGPIPKGYVIHHKDHNKQNNCIENLELLTRKEHSELHSNHDNKKLVDAAILKTSKPVLQYTLDGEFVAEYPSINEASRQTGIDLSTINTCCNGRKKKCKKNNKKYAIKSAGGFLWKYK